MSLCVCVLQALAVYWTGLEGASRFIMTRGGSAAARRGRWLHVRKSPENAEDLRPWLAEVDRARRRGMDIPPLRYIAPLLDVDADFRWSIACARELLDIIAASGISYPLNTSVNSEVYSNSVVESEDSVSTDSENVPANTYHLRQPYSYARYTAMNHRHVR